MFNNIQLGDKCILTENTAQFFIDEKIFSVNIVMKTLFLYLDKLYVFLKHEPDGLYIQIIKKSTFNGLIEDIIGDISNALLNTALIEKTTQDNIKIREEIVTRALGYSLREAVVLVETNPPIQVPQNIDELLSELDEEFDLVQNT